MSRLSLRPVAIVCGLLIAAPDLGRAQDSASRRDLDPLARLSEGARYSIELLYDSARVAGLPIGPLESKALEGISKKVDGRRIVMAVRAVFRSLRDARAVLGPAATPDELNAAAGALRVGVTAVELGHLARLRHEKQQLTVPLVVLADLVTRGVPRDTASTTIFQLWQRGAADEDFLGLWRGVERDIVSGTAPGVALLNRAREIPPRGPPPAAPPASGARPERSETPNP